MNSSTYKIPSTFYSHSPGPLRGQTQSADPSESDSSSSSQITALSVNKNRSPYSKQPETTKLRTISTDSSNASTASLNSYTRPPISHANSDLPLRRSSPFGTDAARHKRQHSQGFFEPTLPTATQSEQSMMTNLTDSQIAAQAAMQQQPPSQHVRKRSLTVPSPQVAPETVTGRRKPPPLPYLGDTSRKTGKIESLKEQQYRNGLLGSRTAAATAANVAFPRSAQLSPGLTTFEAPSEKEPKLKTERSKIKLFSKPKQLIISSNKDIDHRDKPLPSPNKMGALGSSGLSRLVNPSMTSLADSTTSGTSSFYATNNASSSTLVPVDRQEKEKGHKHHFLSRQKNKLKDKIEDHGLPLSSASSNSKPVDPSALQSLYSFAPASPAPTMASFSKSVSGLDLRHGGRALREKKKEEKASAAVAGFDPKRADAERADWAPHFGFASSTAQSFLGSAASGVFGGASGVHSGDWPLAQVGIQGCGLSNMSLEDAWDHLKVKLLIVFNEEESRVPIEDLNRLVCIHIQNCIAKRTPTIITEDLRELLRTGFQSLDQTLRGVPDHRLVPRLVEMWLFVFGTILPYMQAVFLPLDLELKGHGTLMTPREAADFWGANPDSTDVLFGNGFDVRRIVLLSYRDNVILPHHDSLKAMFSRLSLDSINATVSLVAGSPERGASRRPSTSASLDPGLASFNSQGSTLLGDGGRSRAASNLSAPELPPFTSPRIQRPKPPPDSSQITQTVARMLQCVSVLASVQSKDEAQSKMEGLAKELKLNWLGRGRTGRNRKGFIGSRIKPIQSGGIKREVRAS